MTNPNGRPSLPPELKEIRKLTRTEVEHRILELWEKTETEINEILHNPATTLRDKTIIRVMLRAIAKGDYSALGFIMDLLFGKQREERKIDLTSSDGSMSQKPQVIVMLPAEDV